MREAFVIGSGPNGLTAAILLAQAGLRTTVLEAEATIGGGTRSAELTLPGFVHDICSAVHPTGVASPIFSKFPLAGHGLEWVQPTLPLAHPLDDGSAAVLERSLDATCARLGPDGESYGSVLRDFVAQWPDLMSEFLQPVIHFPKKPLLMAHFGWLALQPAARTATRVFRTERGRALFAGCAAHSLLPLEAWGTAAFGWVLAVTAHGAGWPIPRGGSQQIANALASYFKTLGGNIVTNQRVRSLEELDSSALVLCDVTPRQLIALGGNRLPHGFRRKLSRYRYGPGVFKMDWALSAPIPWKAAECRLAGTVHVGGTIQEIARSERAAWEGRIDEHPFVLVAQPSLFDSSRAPARKHTAWAYCHVPNGSLTDMTERIENQMERFAPGFRDCILARHVFNPSSLEHHNANLIGGDITGGANNLTQLVFRPTRRLYRTPLDHVYLCSSSTPPGGGVHGMCGYHAARIALSASNIVR